MPRTPILSQQAPLRVVVAPNAFKGSLSAQQAAEGMTRGVLAALSDATCVSVPMADGGDGSVDAFVAAGFTRVPVEVRGPKGQATQTTIAVREGVAVIELADACGMVRLPGGALAPLTSSTLGLGDAILAALDTGCTRLLVCLGGSASTDGGSGALVALGARLRDSTGADVVPCGAGLASVARLDLAGLDRRLAHVDITIAVDVSSPLHGPQGAAAVFAPQKGASAAEVALLDDGLRSWAHVLAEATGVDASDVPGAGAAGGTAAGLIAATRCHVRAGADVIGEVVGLDAKISRADLVITGEGRLDDQSALGKGSLSVAARCRAAGVPVLAVCGAIDLPTAAMQELGFAAWSDGMSIAADAADAMRRAGELVASAAHDAVQLWLSQRRNDG